MTHDLLIRGFDDKIHSQLGELAKEKGVSINSIVPLSFYSLSSC